MCIAIYKVKGKTLLDKTINSCWEANPDGAGFMYAEDNILHTVKGLMTIEAFKTAYKEHESKEMVIHFRIATHGGISQENTHPFEIDSNLSVVHNGIIHKVDCKTDKTKTDTWHFIDQYLKKFRKTNKNFWLKPEYKELLEMYLGSNKLIFMDNKGNIDIYNESLGIWEQDCWFSNSSFRTYAYSKKTTTPSYGRTQRWNTKYNNWENFEEPTPGFTSSNIASLEFQKERLKSLTDLKIGDFVKLDMDILTFNYNAEKEQSLLAGTPVKVTSCFNQNAIWILDIETNQEACVPLWKLSLIEEVKENTYDPIKPGDEVVFISNHNHFRIGDIKEVVLTSMNHVTIQDTKKEGRCYLIPKVFVKPISSIFQKQERTL